MATKTISPDKYQRWVNHVNCVNWDSATAKQILAGNINFTWGGVVQSGGSISRLTYTWPNDISYCDSLLLYIPFQSQSAPGRCAAYLSSKDLTSKSDVVDTGDWVGAANQLTKNTLSSSTTPYLNNSCTLEAKNDIWYGSGSNNSNYNGIYFKFNIKQSMVPNQKYYIYILQSESGTCSLYGQTAVTTIINYPDTYTITYNANGGKSTPASQTKTYGVALTLAANPGHDSSTKTITTTFDANGGSVSPASRNTTATMPYTFAGWKATNGTVYSAGGNYTANESTTMTAQWTPGSWSGASVSLPTPSRSGYDFDGQYTADGTKKTSYYPTDNSTLYAQRKAKTYTLTFNANGGTNTSGSNFALTNPPTGYGATESWVTVTYDSSNFSTMSANIPTRLGYEFLGWYTADNKQVYNANGIAVDGDYWNTENFYIDGGRWCHDGNLTVYAHWTANNIVYIYDDSKTWQPYIVYIYEDDINKFQPYVPYIYDGSQWVLYSGE